MNEAIEVTAEYLASDQLSALPNIRHGFFTRNGGVSDGVYATLNCGLGSDDDRSTVGHNRQRVAEALTGVPGTDAPLVTGYQVHGTNVARVGKERRELPDADGLVTTERGVAVGVLTADCGPVLFADPDNSVIGAAHAGWKGAVSGVLEATVHAMENAGAQRSSIHAVLGPCISAASYEVGPEFRENVVNLDPGYDRFFSVPDGGERAHFDLPGFIEDRLNALELAAASVLHRCTYLEKGRFFSYRRSVHMEEPDYGRQISAIVLT